jgi:hypothetical protein
VLTLAGVVRLDSQDALAYVDEGWLDFVRRSLKADLTEATALGRSFSDFAPDAQLGPLYRLVFRRVRTTGQPMRVPFRCDLSGERWHMDMEVVLSAGGQVECRYHTVLVEGIAALAAGGKRPERLLTRCAWCPMVKLPEGNWAGAEALADRLDFFIGVATRVTHGICPSCTASVRAAFTFAK